MLSLTVIIWLTGIAALAGFWWQSDAVKHYAMDLVSQHCREQGIQLLDQSMVIQGLWPVRNMAGSLQLRRRYVFEFTSTGEERYRGVITLVGRQKTQLELEPYVIH